MRLLIVDGYTKAGRARIEKLGMEPQGVYYGHVAISLAPELEFDVFHVAEPDASLGDGVSISDYDGVLWTGSSLTIYEDKPEVTRQIDFARACFDVGVFSFGSCWAIQIAAAAAGGVCSANTKGQEFGIARKVSLNEAGRVHPMFAGKPRVFDALASHYDMIETMPPDSALLASNEMTVCQGVEIRSGKGQFWGVQYHPEWTLTDIANLSRGQAKRLADEGFFADEEDAGNFAAKLEALDANPNRQDIAWQIGADETVLDKHLRTLEIKNWLEAVKRGERNGS